MMNMKEEIMNDMMDDAMEEDAEEDAEQVVNKVLDELGLEMGGEMSQLGTGGLSDPLQQPTQAPTVSIVLLTAESILFILSRLPKVEVISTPISKLDSIILDDKTNQPTQCSLD